MRAIDADALQLAIVEEGQANKRKKYIIGDIWELTGAEIREVINSQPTIQPEQNWIPCDIGLPNIGESVLVTLDTEEVCEMKLWEVAGVEQYWCDPYDGYTYEFDRVLAWCEKPEPYKGVTE